MDNLINKVITSTNLGNATDNAGLLAPPKAQKFLDYVWDASVLGGQVRKVRMGNDVQDINKIGVGRRLLRAATEAVADPMNVRPAFTKISLTSAKVRLDWELSTEVLEDNLEGPALEDHIARLITAQIAQDTEDLMINGDVTSTDALLTTLDGWQKRGEVDGTVVDHAGGAISRELLGSMVKKLPREHQQRNRLKFFANGGLVQDYTDLLTTIVQTQGVDPLARFNVDAAPAGDAGYSIEAGYGLRFQEVPLMETDDSGNASIWLTNPQNLIWGIRSEVRVYREFNVKSDSVEYTVFTRLGCAVEDPDAFVVATNVKVKN